VAGWLGVWVAGWLGGFGFDVRGELARLKAYVRNVNKHTSDFLPVGRHKQAFPLVVVVGGELHIPTWKSNRSKHVLCMQEVCLRFAVVLPRRQIAICISTWSSGAVERRKV
jgi:hypothetical protein